MRAMKRISLLAVLLLLLAACTPTVTGTSGRSPLSTSGGQQIQATPGQVLWLSSTFTPQELGFRDHHFEAVLMTTESSSRASGNIATWVSIAPQRVPAFWEVEMEEARVVMEAQGSRTIRYLEVVWRLEVPAAASLGTQDVRVRFTGRGGSQDVTVPVRVRQMPVQSNVPLSTALATTK